MPRVKRGFKARRRRAKVLKQAKGYYGRRKNTWRRAVECVHRSWVYQFRDRKVKKREFRKLWITRINAAVRPLGLTYSQFIHKLTQSSLGLNRKMLADLAVTDPQSFVEIVKKVQQTAA